MKKIRKLFGFDEVGILFVLPAFLYMIVFVGYPIVSNIILSFQDVTASNLVKGIKNFVGLENYISLFNDTVFLKAFSNTLFFTISCILIQFTIGFVLA